MKKNIAFSVLLGFAVSAFAFYVAFKNVSFAELASYLSDVDYLMIVPAVAVSLFSFVLRVLRWRVILSATAQLKFRDCFHPLMIGFMLNCVLPGRAGEAARPLILYKNSGVPFSTGLATVAAERLFDLMVLLTLMAYAFMTVDIDPDLEIVFGDHHLNRDTLVSIGQGMIKLAAVLVAGFACLLVERTRTMIIRIVLAAPKLLFFTGQNTRDFVRDKIAGPAVGVVENFASGLALIKRPSRIGLCLIYSYSIWMLQALSFYVVSLGCAGLNLSFTRMVVYLVIVCIFIALPSVPGFWGLWEAGGVFALSLFGVPAGEAMGYTLTNHVVQVFPVMFVGFISLAAAGVGFRRISRETALAGGSAEPSTHKG